MAATLPTKLTHKLFVYGWVTAINIMVLSGLWFVSPLGYRPISTRAMGFIPTAPIDKTTLGPNVVTGTPVHLVIAAQGIDLDVLPGQYDPTTQTWNIAPYQAQVAKVSMPLNTNTGNTLIYGHNNKHVFYNLRKITVGTQLLIATDNGYTFKYQFASSKNVEPNDTSVFKFDGAPTVTIQTCTGNCNETRGMYLFKLTGVEKS
jgi:LPXTG-site transpeptidase (sortase) family protein